MTALPVTTGDSIATTKGYPKVDLQTVAPPAVGVE